MAAVVWYLGFARYRYINPASAGVCNWSMYVSDAGNIPEPVDEAESDTEPTDTDMC